MATYMDDVKAILSVFFRLLFITIKELISHLWVTDKIKILQGKQRTYYQIRSGMFFLSMILGTIAIVMWYRNQAPYYFTSYPSSDKYVVDSGILSEVYIRQGQDYLILTKNNGTKIRLEEFSGFDDLQEHYGVEEFKVKVWWFPLKYSSHGWIANMEIAAKSLELEREQKQKFSKYSEDFLDGIQITLNLFIPALIAFLWEFIIQYKLYKRGEK